MADRTLELYDLDGTLNSIDINAALNGESNDEVQYYMIAAAEYVAKAIGLPQDEVFEGMKVAMLQVVFPNRAQPEYWASFPSTNGTPVPVSPAVDHYLLTPPALEIFLKRRLAEEGGTKSKLTTAISDFLAQKDWRFQVYNFASKASLPHSHIEEDAIGVLEDRLRANALATVFTNSSATKAVTLLEKAGFKGRISEGGIEPGKIGAIGNALKFQVDPSEPEGSDSHIDLTPYYGQPTKLDVRRAAYKRKVDELMAQTGANGIFMATDIPELDLYPLKQWFGDRATHGMKTNQTSAPESIAAAKALLNAKISNKLSDLVVDL